MRWKDAGNVAAMWPKCQIKSSNEDCHSLIQKRLSGSTWKGARGETYQIKFGTGKKATCTRTDAEGVYTGNRKYFDMWYDESYEFLWWGVKQSFFLDLADVLSDDSEVKWYRGHDWKKMMVPSFAWKKSESDAKDLKPLIGLKGHASVRDHSEVYWDLGPPEQDAVQSGDLEAPPGLKVQVSVKERSESYCHLGLPEQDAKVSADLESPPGLKSQVPVNMCSEAYSDLWLPDQNAKESVHIEPPPGLRAAEDAGQLEQPPGLQLAFKLKAAKDAGALEPPPGLEGASSRRLACMLGISSSGRPALIKRSYTGASVDGDTTAGSDMSEGDAGEKCGGASRGSLCKPEKAFMPPSPEDIPLTKWDFAAFQ